MKRKTHEQIIFWLFASLTTIIAFSLLFILMTAFQKASDKDLQITSLSTQLMEMSFKNHLLYEKLEPIEPIINIIEIAEENANAHEWEYKVYDCTQFSTDLIKKLKEFGWNARMETGFWFDSGNNCSQSNYKRFKCRHDWVILEVPIEATTGKIIDPEIYKEQYK